MKKWGIVVAVALTLFVGVKEVGAQTAVVLTPTLISDPVICPSGCTANVVTVVVDGGVMGGATIYTVTGTNTPLAVPGGYDPSVMSVFSTAVTPTASPTTGTLGGGAGTQTSTVGIGTLGTQYADGRYAGFYIAPNGKYYPITVTDKNAGRKAKYHPSDVYNCPADSAPYFGTDAETWTKCCRGGGCPAGNRVKITGRCNAHKGVDGDTAYDTLVTITNTCTPKCQDAGTTFVGKYKWVCNKDGDNCRNVLQSYVCQPIGVSGKVYYDEFNTCSIATPWNLGAGMSVNVRGTSYTGLVVGGGVDGGQYVVNTPDTSTTYSYLDLLGIPSGYMCASACGGCPTKTGIYSRSIGNNFFLTKTNAPRLGWWQAQGAGVYVGSRGGGVTLQSLLPSNRSLIEAGIGGAIGALMRASGEIDMGDGVISEAGYNATTTYQGKIMNYDFFAPQMGLISSKENDWGADTMNKPSNDPSRDYFYLKPASGSASVVTPWNVLAGESYVVLVNGDLRIESEITVEQGGFLAFVVKGDITIDPAVRQVQGIYVMNDKWISESVGETGDVALEVEGSVVAWGGVELKRDLLGDNTTTPAERFVYRPDLVANMPEKMKVFAWLWSEVAPGTFN